MASSDSSITTLLRPRVISVAVIAVAAAATVGFGLWHDSRRRAEQEEEIRRAAGSLHRSNAVRRNRRASTEPSNAQTNGHDPSDGILPDPLAGQVTDENAVATAQTGAGGEPAETVIDDAEADERWLDDMSSQAVVHRAGQNIVSLLFRVSEDNARRSSYVHRGCACNACGIVPIRGIRYRCANCADFDLCETCESQGLHIKTHIFYKVKVPAPPFGPRQMQPVWYPGDPDTRVRNLSKNLINRLSRETGFERQELEAFWEQWTYMANTEWREDPDELFLAMDRKTFERCLVPSGGYRHTAPNLIHDRMFAFYDTNNDDLIGFSEFLHGLSYRKRKDKLRKIFDGYDTDRDGYVSRRDFLRFFRAYYVLYKQMQKDILEGLDDQVMSSIETHQLVNGRQPLSSMFGREGRVPAADLQRVMAGKAINNQTGEIIVEDSPNGIVAEDGTDTANREDLMSRLFTRWSRHLTSPGMYEDRYNAVGQEDVLDVLDDGLAASNYWDALLNPPARVQGLPNLLIGQVDPSSQANIDDDDGLFVPNADTYGNDPDADGEDLHWVGLDSASERPHAFQDASRSASGTSSPGESPVVAEMSAANGSSDTNDGNSGNSGSADTPAHEVNGHTTNGDTGSQSRQSRNNNDGTGFAVLDGNLQEQYRPSDPHRRPRFNPRHPPTAGQIRAQYEASTRTMKLRSSKIVARRKLHNRWMRRNFYLDEEEGATVPDQWRTESDILAGASISDAAGEPSSAARVRFSEGATSSSTDEYENQPSPSSSARTVLPDTWGGDNTRYPDIPEAERDAGREILYQVMQQSFNEMLDTLFVEKEDLAVAAAETKDKRDQYRHLFENIDLLREWAESGGAAGQQDKTDTPSSRGKTGRRSSGNETLDRPLEQLDLEELLSIAGYQVDESAFEDNGEREAGASTTAPPAPEANDAELTAVDRLVREGAPEPESEAGEDIEATAPETQPEVVTEAAEEKEEKEETEEKVKEEGETDDDKDSDDQDSDDEEKEDSTGQAAASLEPRDSTLPQFRPNTEAEYRALMEGQTAATAKITTTATTTTNLSTTVEDEQADKPGAEPKGKEKEKAAGPTATAAAPAPQSPDIPRSELVRWKRLDMAEREAHVRGGWGKLSYSEFEAIFRREELKNNRLDYLGSWIDFCIP
ncbi:ef hand domain-containing protein [Ophiostoma piceae UAMH 11346]|uniref:Ef hand domain-containing protein n=1 Tax=Ophiostoma piceae (strain UAMH 11346) TaxID=1262450 RepID=S3C0E6_OPHP1|nr:ef hand domain-containing protein [Ophiostoma piceae UAMH 11346]